MGSNGWNDTGKHNTYHNPDTVRAIHGGAVIACVDCRAIPAPREVVPVAEPSMKISSLFRLEELEFRLHGSKLRKGLPSEFPIELKSLSV